MQCPKCNYIISMDNYTHWVLKGFVTYYYCRNCGYRFVYDWNKEIKEVNSMSIKNFKGTEKVASMMQGKCPTCNGEEIFLHKTITRDGVQYKLRCKTCGFMCTVMELEEKIEPEETVMNVVINNKITNLIVDEINFNEKLLKLVAP